MLHIQLPGYKMIFWGAANVLVRTILESFYKETGSKREKILFSGTFDKWILSGSVLSKLVPNVQLQKIRMAKVP